MSGIRPAITRYSTHRLVAISAVPPVEITIDVVSKHARAALLLACMFVLFMTGLQSHALLVQLRSHTGVSLAENHTSLTNSLVGEKCPYLRLGEC